MALGAFLQALGGYLGQSGQGQMGPMPQNAMSKIGGYLDAGGKGIATILQNPGLQQLGAMDTQRREDEHMAKVFAANPQFAQQLYGAKNQSALLKLEQQKKTGPRYEQVGSALLKILPDGTFEKVFEATGSQPAAIQIADEVEKALKDGNIDRANRLMQIQKVYDKGINPYGLPTNQGGGYTPDFNPNLTVPGEPPIGNGTPTSSGFPDIGAQNNPELDALAAGMENGTIPTPPITNVGPNIIPPQTAPIPQAMPGYAGAVAGIAAEKNVRKHRRKKKLKRR